MNNSGSMSPSSSSSSLSSLSSSSSNPFIPTNNNIAHLPPPPQRPWTSGVRIALYKHTPPRYLTHPVSAEDALIKKRPGRPCSYGAAKKRALMSTASSASDATSESLDQARLDRMLSNRLSARKSRLQKQEYMESLRRAVIIKEDKIAELSPKLKDYECLNILLRTEKLMLLQSVQSLETLIAEKEVEYMAMQQQIYDLVCYLNIAAIIHRHN